MKLQTTRTSVTSTGGAVDRFYRAAGSRPTLDQRFAKDKSLTDKIGGTDLITFSRASSGTYVDSDGLIKTSTVNHFTYSEDFTNSWSISRASITANAGVAPDGTQTADKVIPNASNADNHFFYKSLILAGTISIFAKSAGYNHINLISQSSLTDSAGVSVNLTDGSIQSIDNATAEVVDVGNGWYRIALRRTNGVAQAHAVFQPHNGGTPVSSNRFRTTFAGDGTSGVLVWGAMHTDSYTSNNDYIPTGATISGAPRFDHDPATGESLGLLIEESRTNYMSQSNPVVFTKGVPETIITLNAFTAPDGTNTAFRLQSTNSFVLVGGNEAVPAGSTIVASYYIYSPTAIQGLRSRLNYGSGNVDDIFDLPAGQWVRHTTTAVTDDTGADTNFAFRVLTAMNSASTAVDVYIWGVQVEVGSFATSLIPTTGSTVTRSPDIATIEGSNFSSWYNQSEGTVFVNVLDAAYGQADSYEISNGNVANRRNIRINASASKVNRTIVGAGLSNQQTSGTTYTGYPVSFKAAATDNFKFFVDGVSGYGGNENALPTNMTQLSLGFRKTQNSNYLNGHISRLAYFPTRRSDQELIKLTGGTLFNPAITYGITIAGNTFSLITDGTVNYAVDWDSTGGYETSTSNTLAHTYADGDYTLVVYSNDVFRTYFNNNADGDRITSVVIDAGANLGTTVQRAWRGADFMTSFECPFHVTSDIVHFGEAWRSCTSLVSFPLIDTSGAAQFGNAWNNCTSLTSFPLLDVSSGTGFANTWNTCRTLTSFPLLDVSSGTNFPAAWRGCSGLTSFPSLDVSSATNFSNTWRQCSSLTSFPLLDVSSGTRFDSGWSACTSLADFPANMFDTTGTLVSGAFNNAWLDCSLTAQSIENILVSLDTNGASNITLVISGGTNAAKTTWSTAANTAYDNLIAKGWSITFNA